MQFEGLQGLLKKKKKQTRDAAVEVSGEAKPPPAAPTMLSSSSPASSNAVPVAADPYDAALRRTQQQRLQKQPELVSQEANDEVGHEDRKRPREALVVDEGSAYLKDDERNTRRVDSTDARPPPPAMKSMTDIRAEQQRGVAVLLQCRSSLERYWASAQRDTTSATSAQGCEQLSSSPLPDTVGSYLMTQFVSDKRVSAATGEPEMALLDREFALLAALHEDMVALRSTDETHATSTAVTAEKTSDAPPKTPSAEQRRLGELIRVLWYLIALRWQYSLDPTQVAGPKSMSSTKAATSAVAAPVTQGLPADQQGWSPYVYLALQGALPPDIRLTLGRAVGQEVDQWRALTRTRQFALELLAYLYSDYITLQAGNTEQACIVPVDLRESLHRMLVQHLQRHRNFMAVRQDYVDATMGTANWKLGLFSGGEVHMRRSMERVERNRIHHLLNNEHATHLLQSVREVTSFAEQQNAQRGNILFSFFLQSKQP